MSKIINIAKGASFSFKLLVTRPGMSQCVKHRFYREDIVSLADGDGRDTGAFQCEVDFFGQIAWELASEARTKQMEQMELRELE